MCVISILEAGDMPEKDELYNSVYNNQHGWGMLVRNGDNTLSLIKEVVDETNPDNVWKALEDNKELVRYLHIRNATVGKVIELNAQPFKFFEGHDNSDELWFMHNGTLQDYSNSRSNYSSSYGNQTYKDSDERSDSLRFADIVLTPYFEGLNDPMDLTDTFLSDVFLDKFWSSYSNRGLIISSNDSDPYLLINEKDWKYQDGQDNCKYLVSNDDYFYKVIRGDEFKRRESREKETLRLENLSEAKSVAEDKWLPAFSDIKEDLPWKTSDIFAWTPKSIESLTYQYLEKRNKSEDNIVSNIRSIFDTTSDLISEQDLSNLALIAHEEWTAIARVDPEVGGMMMSTIIYQAYMDEIKMKNLEKRDMAWKASCDSQNQIIANLREDLSKQRIKNSSASNMIAMLKEEEKSLA